jgi:signal peptidase I
MKNPVKKRFITFMLAFFCFVGCSVFTDTVYASGTAGGTEAVLQVKQTFQVDGKAGKVEEQFDYILTSEDSDNPMPDGTAADGTYRFSVSGTAQKDVMLTYTHAGIYEYTLKQNTDNPKARYTYDKEVYTVYVIMRNTDGGSLQPEIVVQNSNHQKSEISFQNRYQGDSSPNNGGGGSTGGTTDTSPVPSEPDGTGGSTVTTTNAGAGDADGEENVSIAAGDDIPKGNIDLPDGQDDAQLRENEGLAQNRAGWLWWLLLLLFLLLLFLILFLLLRSRDYRRGDVVILKHKDHGRLVRRIIGMPGETVRINSYTSQVMIDDEPLEEPYVTGRTSCKEQNFCQISLGEDQYFVMDDNRENTVDSRSFGAVEKDWLKRRAITRKHYKFDR